MDYRLRLVNYTEAYSNCYPGYKNFKSPDYKGLYLFENCVASRLVSYWDNKTFVKNYGESETYFEKEINNFFQVLQKYPKENRNLLNLFK